MDIFVCLLCLLFYRRNLVSPELAKPSYQLILQGESIQASLLSIQIDKYENQTPLMRDTSEFGL